MPQQVVPAHPRLARHAGGDDADIGAFDVGIGLRALERRVKAFCRTGFGDVERLALGNALGDVEEDDVTQFLQCHEMRQRAADLAGADERDFGSGHAQLSVPVRFRGLPSVFVGTLQGFSAARPGLSPGVSMG